MISYSAKSSPTSTIPRATIAITGAAGIKRIAMDIIATMFPFHIFV
ncbi:MULTISPECIES: hypothetical protein [Clostridium]|nr:hypothetical protein [Clostridium sporogenes]MCW6087702.1 hypothetical protein [Clostridium sporogenes]